MQSLPIQFIFGWLFTIHPNNVNEEARDALIRYQLECYNALFLYFSEKTDFLQDKQTLIDEKATKFQTIQFEFKSAKERLAKAKDEFNEARAYSFEQWKAEKMQLTIPFPENP